MAEKMKEEQYAEWDAFVDEAKGGTVFHRSWHLRALARQVEIHVLRGPDGKIEAGMALTPMRFLGTRAARRPVWTAYNGPLIRPSRKGSPADRASDEKNLMLRLLAESPALGMYDYILPPEYADVMPFLWNGFDILVGYTYQIPPAPPDEWRAAMSSGHRRDLRKAGEVLASINGTIETVDDFTTSYSLIGDTAESKQFEVRAGLQTLTGWWEAIRVHAAGTLYVVRQGDGRVVCTTVLVWDGRCAYYLASGIRADARRGSLNLLSRLLIDRMIRDTHERGLAFDFEGSVLPGVERFFRGWGGRCVPKYRAVKIRTSWSFAAWSLHRWWTGHHKTTWFRDE